MCLPKRDGPMLRRHLNPFSTHLVSLSSGERMHERELKDAHAALLVAGSNRGVAEATLRDVSKKLDERTEARRMATEALQDLASMRR